MTFDIEWWWSFQEEISEQFVFSKFREEAAARLVSNTKQNISLIKERIEGNNLILVGAGLKNDTKIPNKNIIVADGAVQALIEHNIKPDILVTDLDGDMPSIKKIGRSKIPIIVHAHGNNYEKLELVTKFQNKIGTTQTDKFGKLENFGGFTDGDRCVFLAEAFKPKKIILFGMDFGNKIGKYSKKKVIDKKTKLKKLEYGKKLLEWIARKSNSELYTTTKPIRGFKNISMTDLEYIVNN